MTTLREVYERSESVKQLAVKFGFTNVRIYNNSEDLCEKPTLYLLVDLLEGFPEKYKMRDSILGVYLSSEDILGCDVIVTCDSRSSINHDSIFEGEAAPIDNWDAIKELFGLNSGQEVSFEKFDDSEIDKFDLIEYDVQTAQLLLSAKKIIEEWDRRNGEEELRPIQKSPFWKTKQRFERSRSVDSFENPGKQFPSPRFKTKH